MSAETETYENIAKLSPGKRAAVLYKQAQALAETNVLTFVAQLESAIEIASEIAEGGEIYPTGIRDICRKLSEQTVFRVQAINAILRQDRIIDHQPSTALEPGADAGRPGFDPHPVLQRRSLHEDDLAAELAQIASADAAAAIVQPQSATAPPFAVALPAAANAPAPFPGQETASGTAAPDGGPAAFPTALAQREASGGRDHGPPGEFPQQR